MTGDEFTTVYRSADMNAEQDASGVYDLLTGNGIDARMVDDKHPGVVEGTWEVRVPSAQRTTAEQLIAQIDQDDPASLLVDPSHELDLVDVAFTEGTIGEMEAMSIQSILDANGIPAVLVGASSLPNLSFQVKVAQEDLVRAKAVIAEAQAAGPAAALEGEQATEPRN